MAHESVSPARRVAQHALLAIEGGQRFEAALRGATAATDLDTRDAALAWELTVGTTKRRRTIDAVLSRFVDYPLRSLSADARCSLRLGAYQLLFLDRVPAHAAVDESVGLVRRSGTRTSGLVNAVLRRVATHGREALAEVMARSGMEGVAVRLSYPTWLVRWLCDEWGAADAEALLEQGDLPAERCLRVHRRSDVRAVVLSLEREGMETRRPAWAEAGLCPEALLVEGGNLESTEAFRQGWVSPQSRASQLVGTVAAAGIERGARVADLCAAPGGKTAHLQALLASEEVLAVEPDPARAAELRTTLDRLHVSSAHVRVADARRLPAALDGRFEVVLVDAPCTGFGTLAARPDLRWRRRPNDTVRMAVLQRELLLRAADLVRPGGRVVYAVCTPARSETVDVVRAVLEQSPLELDDLGSVYPTLRDSRLGGALLTWPPRDGTSGFFIARLQRG